MTTNTGDFQIVDKLMFRHLNQAVPILSLELSVQGQLNTVILDRLAAYVVCEGIQKFMDGSMSRDTDAVFDPLSAGPVFEAPQFQVLDLTQELVPMFTMGGGGWPETRGDLWYCWFIEAPAKEGHQRVIKWAASRPALNALLTSWLAFKPQ